MSTALLVGFFWGLFEGTWFFIVPDIALSLFALKGWRTLLVGMVAVILGAMASAILLFSLFTMFPAMPSKIVQIWQSLPGFYPKMLDVAATHLKQKGARGLILGPNSGIPYRFYVLEAFKQKIPLNDLLWWTPIARIERIAIAPLAVFILKFFLKKKYVEKKVNHLLVFVILFYWIWIYIWYWGFFLPKTY